MSISTVTDTTGTSAASLPSSTTTLGKEDFLTLLVAQLEHQDPLDPQDNAEFVAQMAQFSSLEQQISSNDKLDELISVQSNVEQMSAFSLLGEKVIVATDNFYLQGDSVELGFSLEGEAETATLDILDEDGKVVASYEMSDLEEGYNFISWDGTNSSGKQVPNGLYTMKISGTDAAGDKLSVQPLVKTVVDEVGPDASGSVLVTDAGNIPFSGISSVVKQ